MDGKGRGREGHPREVGSIPGRTRGAEVETEGEALGEVFFRVVVEVGVVADLDLEEHSWA